jgi:ankyrin repeat protein
MSRATRRNYKKRKNKTRRIRGGGIKEDKKLWDASKSGDLEKVTYLLTKDRSVRGKTRSLFKKRELANVNSFDNYGTTALDLASKNGHTDVVKALIKHGANVNNKSDRYLNTALHLATLEKHTETVKALISNGALTNTKNQSGNTPLHLATKNSDTESMKELIKSGANVNEEDHNGKTPLHFATLNGDKDNVNLLLSKGANPNSETSKGITPLHLAAESGNDKIVDNLLKAGANKKTKNFLGWTPVHEAISNGHLDIVKKLVPGGPVLRESVKIKPFYHYETVNLPYLSSGQKSKQTKKFLENHLKNLKLIDAARTGDIESAQKALDKGENVNEIDFDGKTAVHHAVENGHVDMVHFLHKNGANLNKHSIPIMGDEEYSPNDDDSFETGLETDDELERRRDASRETMGETPLHIASKMGDSRMIDTLVSSGGDVNAFQNETMSPYTKSFTPLHYASMSGHLDTVNTLINQGADPTLKKDIYHPPDERTGGYEIPDTIVGKTPVDVASTPEIRDVLQKNSDLLTASKEKGNYQRVKGLLSQGANPNVRSADGNSALHHASKNDDKNTTNLLIEYGANPLVQNKEGNYPHDISLKVGTDIPSLINLAKMSGYK